MATLHQTTEITGAPQLFPISFTQENYPQLSNHLKNCQREEIRGIIIIHHYPPLPVNMDICPHSTSAEHVQYDKAAIGGHFHVFL